MEWRWREGLFKRRLYPTSFEKIKVGYTEKTYPTLILFFV